MLNLTNEQINEIASAKPGEELTRLPLEVAFPILRLIDQQLALGARIEVRDGKICLIGANGEVIARGNGLQELFIEAIFVLC